MVKYNHAYFNECLASLGLIIKREKIISVALHKNSIIVIIYFLLLDIFLCLLSICYFPFCNLSIHNKTIF